MALPGDRSDLEAERDMTDADGVGEAGCEGGNGLMDASSSAPPHLRDMSSASEIRGRTEAEASERIEGERDRVRKDMDCESSVESRGGGGTGMEGYGLFASLILIFSDSPIE